MSKLAYIFGVALIISSCAAIDGIQHTIEDLSPPKFDVKRTSSNQSEIDKFKAAVRKNPSDTEAQFNLGVMFYKGRGVIQDYLLADIWFIRSSLQKNQEAFKYISLVEKLMSPQQRKKAQQMAKYWERWD